MIVSAVTLLPQPDSPDDAERLAWVDREAHAVDGLDRPVHDVEVDLQVAYVEQGLRMSPRPARRRPRDRIGHAFTARDCTGRGRRAGRLP